MNMLFTLDKGAYAPEKAHASDAGYDLRTPVCGAVFARDSSIIDTGIHIAIPEGYCGKLVSKSGLNVNHDITSTGLIDAGYTGSIKVKLYNHGGERYFYKRGDKVTQLVVQPIAETELVQVEALEDTERGDGGFGSTGR